MPSDPLRSPHRKLFWFAAIAIGLLQVCAHRNDINPDGISYIELAWASVHSGLHALVSGYWSPLYPFFLSVVFRFLHPSLYWEFTVVHGVNFLIYVVNIACFEVFLKQLISLQEDSRDAQMQFQSLPLWNLGYLQFLWACQFWLSPSIVNPDLCVAALIYLATAILLRFARGKINLSNILLLGVILALAYLAKAAMFPLAFVFLACVFFLVQLARGPMLRSVGCAWLATAIFLIAVGPYVVSLSQSKGRPTFGDSGKIAYAEYIDRAPLNIHWQGDPPGTGVPAHPTRKIFADPAVYEFASPVPGSYPPWRDPSYWYEGITPHFSLRGQLWTLFRTSNAYLRMFSKTGILYFILIAVFALTRKEGKWRPISVPEWLVFFPSFAALALYALVQVEFRYVSSFALILLLWIFSCVQIKNIQDAPETAPRKCASLVLLLAPTLAIAFAVSRDSIDLLRNRPNEPWQVVQGLHQMGIPPGTPFASIGTGLDAYWAHLAQMRVIAEIPGKDQTAFVSADAAKKHAILVKFQDAGAKAVFTKDVAVVHSMPGWHQINGTRFYLFDLSATPISQP